MSRPPLPRILLWMLRRAAGPMAEEVEGDVHELVHRWTRNGNKRVAWLRALAIQPAQALRAD